MQCGEHPRLQGHGVPCHYGKAVCRREQCAASHAAPRRAAAAEEGARFAGAMYNRREIAPWAHAQAEATHRSHAQAGTMQRARELAEARA